MKHEGRGTPDEIGPTTLEEVVHSLTHGAGAVLALVALQGLWSIAAPSGSATTAIAIAIFGIGLTAVYVASTIYHAVPLRFPRAKAALQIVDHAAIHLLIAGTLTPFALCAIGGFWGWLLFGISWSIACAGVVIETTPLRHSSRLSLMMYLGAGWFGLLALPFLWVTTPLSAILLLGLGGIAYTAGVPFFLAHKTKWMHALWHAFVMLGSALHVAAITVMIAA